MEKWQNLSTGKKISMILWGLLLVMVIIFSCQNWQSASVDFLWGSSSIPVIALILLCTSIGFGAGYLVCRIRNQAEEKS